MAVAMAVNSMVPKERYINPIPNNKKAEDTEASIRYFIPASMDRSFDFSYAIRIYKERVSVSIPRKKMIK